MATRPVFVPDADPDHAQLVHEHEVDFQWVPGSSPEARRENIVKLHAAAGHRNLDPLLEVSEESNHPLGVFLGVSNLAVEDDKSYLVPLPAAYQGSKVFTGGGPFTDLFTMGDEEIAADERLTGSGDLAGFRFGGLEWGLKAGTMFYDWLTVQAIHRYPKLRRGLRRFMGFTEIDCRVADTGVCHARSCALYAALAEKKLLEEVVGSQDRFIEVLLRDSFYGPTSGTDG